jgi:hypothetical protein
MDMRTKGQYFDENGQRYLLDNVDLYVTQLSDNLLVEVYRETIHQHELIPVVNELVEKGYLIREEETVVYEPELTDNVIKSMRVEIVDRWDEEFHDKVINSIDLSFIDNKPKNL